MLDFSLSKHLQVNIGCSKYVKVVFLSTNKGGVIKRFINILPLNTPSSHVVTTNECDHLKCNTICYDEIKVQHHDI